MLILSHEQLEAVNAGPGAWKVEACAGSGKTRVITERYKRLVASGDEPDNIICLTFTRQSASEMSKRAGVGKNGSRGGFMTLHGFAYKMLLREQDKLPFKLAENPVASSGRARSTIEKIIKPTACLTYGMVKAYISLKMRAAISPMTAPANAGDPIDIMLASAYGRYTSAMMGAGLMDFDMMAFWAWKLLGSDSGVRGRWRFKWIQVDEAQDLDRLQWLTVSLLAGGQPNIMAVADANQSMYAFRGAEPDALLHMERMFPGCKTLYLSSCYRSTKAIVDFCKRIAPYQGGLIERLNTQRGTGEQPQHGRFGSDDEEAHGILMSVRSPEHTAVLTRTNSALRPFEDKCLQLGIRYKLLGKSGFWVRPEIKDVVAFLKFIENPSDNGAVAQIILSPYRISKYLGRAFLKSLKAKHKLLFNGLTDVSVASGPGQANSAARLYLILDRMATDLRGVSPMLAIRNVIGLAGILDHLYDQAGADVDSAKDNFAVENLFRLEQSAAQFASTTELVVHAAKAQWAAEHGTGLSLGTIHQAKGKEWRDVYVACVNKGVFPHKLGDIEEEKRIFYVACSRAADRLVVTSSDEPSEFVKVFEPQHQLTPGGSGALTGSLGEPVNVAPAPSMEKWDGMVDRIGTDWQLLFRS